MIKSKWFRLRVAIASILFTMVAPLAPAQQVSSSSDVDNSSMGVYRALAQLTLDASQRGDGVSAAKLARVIELVWDSSESDLRKSSPDVYELIDNAMDGFIKPIMDFKRQAVNLKLTEQDYRNYLDKLKIADRPR